MWKGRLKSVGELDVPAIMAPALCSFVFHHHCRQWSKVNVKRHLADGCFCSRMDVNRDISSLSFLFLWSLYKAPEAQEKGKGKQETQKTSVSKFLNLEGELRKFASVLGGASAAPNLLAQYILPSNIDYYAMYFLKSCLEPLAEGSDPQWFQISKDSSHLTTSIISLTCQKGNDLRSAKLNRKTFFVHIPNHINFVGPLSFMHITEMTQ